MTSDTAENSASGGEIKPPAGPPEIAPGQPGSAPRRGVFRRILGWFWNTSAAESLKQARRLPSAQVIELNRRARGALELCVAAVEPASPYTYGPLDAQACDLARQAVYWALLGHAALAGKKVEAANSTALVPAAPPDFEALVEQTDSELLRRATGDLAMSTDLLQSVAKTSFLRLAELPSDQQARLARELRGLAEGLCAELDQAQVLVEKLWISRIVRVGALVVVILAIVGGVFLTITRLEEGRDLARDKAWVASSRYPEGNCQSPKQECDESPFYFFATNEEEDPSIEFDLGSVDSISGLRVDNRTDGGTSERAVPLVVEVSVDHRHWQQVARRAEDFVTWKANFKPEKARWVKLHVPRKTFLHLKRVRILH